MPSMDEIKLSLSQSGPSGELSIIRVDGVVDTITASELEKVIESLVTQQKYKILVDLGGVEYISSAGWGIFISRIQEVRDNEGDIKLVNMIPNVYEIYELLEFQNIIPAYNSLESGKQSFDLGEALDGPIEGEKVWKTEEKIVTESGTSFQNAMSPGQTGGAGTLDRIPAKKLYGNADSLVLELVIADPFSSIGEIAAEADEVAPQFELGWWKVFSILRRNKLLSRRARFRLARRRARRN